jgi:hypothetical protein
VSFIYFSVIKIKDECYGYHLGMLVQSLDIDGTHLVERPGLMYNQLLGVSS